MTKLKDLDKYDTLLDLQKSDTTDTTYEIRWSKEHGYFCTCAGWQSSKKKPKTCKHVKRSQFKLAIEPYVSFDKTLCDVVLDLAKTIWKGQV